MSKNNEDVYVLNKKADKMGLNRSKMRTVDSLQKQYGDTEEDEFLEIGVDGPSTSSTSAREENLRYENTFIAQEEKELHHRADIAKTSVNRKRRDLIIIIVFLVASVAYLIYATLK